jgi:hypothetical protein
MHFALIADRFGRHPSNERLHARYGIVCHGSGIAEPRAPSHTAHPCQERSGRSAGSPRNNAGNAGVGQYEPQVFGHQHRNRRLSSPAGSSETAGGHPPAEWSALSVRGENPRRERTRAQIGKKTRLRARRQVVDVVEAVLVGDDQHEKGRCSQGCEDHQRARSS